MVEAATEDDRHKNYSGEEVRVGERVSIYSPDLKTKRGEATVTKIEGNDTVYLDHVPVGVVAGDSLVSFLVAKGKRNEKGKKTRAEAEPPRLRSL